jgi:hypothetical protein
MRWQARSASRATRSEGASVEAPDTASVLGPEGARSKRVAAGQQGLLRRRGRTKTRWRATRAAGCGPGPHVDGPPVHGLRKEGHCGPPGELPVMVPWEPPWPRPPRRRRPRLVPEGIPPVCGEAGRGEAGGGEAAGNLLDEVAMRAEGGAGEVVMLSSASRRSARTSTNEGSGR